VKKELQSEANKKLAINAINAKLDLPKLSEVEEEKLIRAVIEAGIDSVVLVIDRL
jgi:hypothetical protein